MSRRTIRDLTNAERDEIVRAYVDDGDTVERLARRFRLGLTSIRNLLVNREVAIRGREEASPPSYLPSPEEIERMKLEIRRGWVADDCNRNVGPAQPRAPRVYRLIGLDRRLPGVRTGVG